MEFTQEQQIIYRRVPTSHRSDVCTSSSGAYSDAIGHVKSPFIVETSVKEQPTTRPKQDTSFTSTCGIPPCVPEYSLYELTNVILEMDVSSAGAVQDVVDAIETGLHQKNCDVLAYDAAEFKWIVEYLSPNDVLFVNFIVRIFRDDSLKGIVVEIQRRDGDAAAFREVFRSVISVLLETFEQRVIGSVSYKKGEMVVAPVPRISFQRPPLPAAVMPSGSSAYTISEVQQLLQVAKTPYEDTKAQAATALAVVVSYKENRDELEKNESVLKELVYELATMMQTKFPPLMRHTGMAVASLGESQKAASLMAPLMLPVANVLKNYATEIGVRRCALTFFHSVARHMGASAFKAKYSWVAGFLAGIAPKIPQQLEEQLSDLLTLLNG